MKNIKHTRREFMRRCAVGACGIFLADLFTFIRDPKPHQKKTEKLWKWSRDAMYYEKTTSGFRCLKCPNGCVIGDKQAGLCRNRVVFGGKMYSIAYGNPCAAHIDPIEKKPFYHFLPTAKSYSVGVAGCNLACLNCQNWQISQVSPLETQNYDLMPDALVDQAKQYKCATIAYTYSEPITFYEYVLDTSKLARKQGIRNLFKSNGYICEEPLRELAGYLDGANIDLKSFDDDVYRRLNAGRLEPVLKTLKILKENNVWVEITNLLIPGWSDDMAVIKKMCEWLVANGLADCPVHFSRFTPMYKLNRLSSTPVATIEKACETARKAGIQYVYIGNVPAHPAEQTYCHSCGKMIIDRRGYAILKNDVQMGKCRFCQKPIPGVWS